VNNIYLDFIKHSSEGVIIGGVVMSSTALLAGSAAMEWTGFLSLTAGYSVLMYLDYLDTMMKCKLLDD
jgi:hypothetical protein